MNKRLILAVKIGLMAAVVAIFAWYLEDAWSKVAAKHVAIDWRYGGIAILGFSGSMLTSALVWRWLAWQMKDRSPTLPLLGAYIFSQLGKYIPGKVALLLMRVDRANRFGMKASICTLSTILENALYMVSGGLIGMLAILRVTQDLSAERRWFIWPVTISAVIVLSAACHPKIFYGLINRLLRRMKKPEIPASRRLRASVLILAVLGFVPCWCFGGLALWASAKCVYALPMAESTWFAGAFALSVIIGMASFLPAGLGIREAVLAAAVSVAMSAHIDHAQALVFGSVAAALLRLFQIIAEALLGALGALMTTMPQTQPPTRAQQPTPGNSIPS